MKLLILPLLAILLMFSCQSSAPSAAQKDLRFFDLEGFVQDFVSDSVLVSVQKKVILNGEEESKELPHYPLYLDIEPIEHYDINRPALYDKYSIDTIVEGPQQVLQYKALDEELSVRKLRITMKSDSDTVQKVEIVTSTHSFLENVEMQLVWHIEDGYSLSRKSNKRLGEPTEQQVIVNRI